MTAESEEPTAVDLHAHLFPTTWLEEAATRPDLYGVEIEAVEDGQVVRRLDTGREFNVTSALSDDVGRLEGLSALGLAQQLAAPPTPMLMYDLERSAAVAVARLYNDSVAALAESSGGRLIPAATVSMCYPDDAVAELDRVVTDLGIRVLFLATSVAGAELDDPRFEPILRRAADLGLLVQLHPCSPDVDVRLQKHALPMLIGNPMETAVAAASLITGGVLDRIPELKVLLVHGGGVFPYLSARMEHGYHQLSRARASARPPRDYFSSFYFDTLVHDESALRFLAATVGAERLVVGTDSPYPMGDFDPLGSLAAAGLSTPAVLHATAQSLIGDSGAQ